MTAFRADSERKRRIAMLAGVGIGSVLLWQTMIGSLLLYPFTILATWFHEMGHGVAAMLTGSRFERLLIYPDGSGLALSLRPSDSSRISNAFVAASGPIGPAIAGAMLIIASRTAKATRLGLTVLGAALIITTLVWVRSLTGWLVLPVLGLAILALSRRGTADQRRLGIQILGIQACISAWRQFGYLFSAGGMVDGRVQRSDTAVMADQLLLPYWLWGAAISAAILTLMWWSFTVALRR